jgi:adenylylsulfate kinase
MTTGFTIWFTGLSGAGKTTLANILEGELRARGHRVEVLDGDVVRTHLSKGLGFSREDRDTNIRRLGYVAGEITRHGGVALVAAISPYRSIRAENRARIGDYVEVFVNAPVATCESRDQKGQYARARRGEIKGFTGVDDPYEPPLPSDGEWIECRTDRETPDESARRVFDRLVALGYVDPADRIA